ncbi:PREDICTED: uncharacterized protein LOC108782162 [Cyphomyrmex costatus]|nr:PREDICTED: uncharacterized protein LOC108782162 [Cyphomyrmex costatus]
MNAALHEQSSQVIADNSLSAVEPEQQECSTEESVTNLDSDDTGSLYRWTTSCVLLLLQTYKENEEKFTNGKQSQKKTWEEISKILKCKGHNITGLMCAAKLRSLKKTYKSIKDHNNKSGNDRKSWQFFEIMDEIFSKKAWCVPVAIASSSGLSKTHEKENNIKSDSECTVEPSRSKQNMSTLLAKRLRQKEEHEEAKKKRHKDRMEMDEKFLSVLEKLANK